METMLYGVYLIPMCRLSTDKLGVGVSEIKRKFACILATDCVGFSKHMGDDEEGTLDSLKTCRKIIDAVIHEQGGRIFHTAGDSVLAEFAGPINCVNAAVNFQNALYDRNKTATDADPFIALEWRVGINSGDVIVEQDNIYGNGVNIAARLESQCNPGQILVSRTVSEQVDTQIKALVKAAGTRTLKNIASDFEVFTVETNSATYPDASPDTTAPLRDTVTQTKPCLAILPFDNLNKNEDSSFLTDGIFEDVTTELAMVRQLSVISRQSSINFGSSGADIEQMIQKFKVDYMVNGSVRSAGKKVRVSISLSAAQNREIMWSKRFDRVLDDIFEVQDEIVRSVVNQILGEIEVSSLERAKRKPTENMNSYEFLLRGKELHHKFEASANATALEMFDAAIKADPENGQAYAWKACTLGQSIIRGFTDTPMTVLFPTVMELIDTAITMDPNDFECHRLLSGVHSFMGEMKLSLEHGKRSYELVPNDPRILQQYGEALLKSNHDVSLGCDLMLLALEIDPIPQGQVNSDKRRSDAVFACFLDEKYQQCLTIASEISNLAPITWLFAVSAELALGQDPTSNTFLKHDLGAYRDADFMEEISKLNLVDRVITGQLRETYSTRIVDRLRA